MNNIKKFYEKVYKEIGDLVIMPNSKPPQFKRETSILRILMEMHEREERMRNRRNHDQT